MATVLVAGGAGYIGAHTAKALAARGHEPVTLDDLSMGHERAVRWGPFVRADVGDRDAVAAAVREHRIEAAVHFAASAYVGESMRNPGKYFDNNVAKMNAFLSALADAGVARVIFSSSCATYGVPEGDGPIGEDHPQRPISPYGESKLMGETLLRWFEECRGVRHVALRYFNAAGASPEGEIGERHEPETHLIPLVMGAALGRREPVTVFGTDYSTPDGTAVRDYVHVSDLAEAHVLALDRLMDGGESLRVNLGTGRGHSVAEVISAVERIGGRPVPRRDGERRAGDPPSLVARPGRARAELGWEPRRSELDAIVHDAWRWETAGN